MLLDRGQRVQLHILADDLHVVAHRAASLDDGLHLREADLLRWRSRLRRPVQRGFAWSSALFELSLKPGGSPPGVRPGRRVTFICWPK
jgi:hypothetical protein